MSASRCASLVLACCLLFAIGGCDLFTALFGAEGLACDRDDACPTGSLCLDGRCRRSQVPPADAGQADTATAADNGPVDRRGDGGVDATPFIDGARPDRSYPDLATADHPSPDHPSADAARPDSTSPDSTSPDSTSPDSELADATPRDTAHPDSAVPDAAVPDTALPPLTVGNPSFEGDDIAPVGWIVFGTQCDDLIYHWPTFCMDFGPDPPEGTYFYGCAIDYSTGDLPGLTGGVLQVLAGSVPGRTYRATVWTFQCETCDTMRNYSEIGLNPEGELSPGSEAVVWSDQADQLDLWSTVSVNAVATGSTMTVLLRYTHGGVRTGCPSPNRFGINYFDLVTVEPVP